MLCSERKQIFIYLPEFFKAVTSFPTPWFISQTLFSRLVVEWESFPPSYLVDAALQLRKYFLLKYLLKPSPDQVLPLIRSIGIDFGEKREVDEHRRLVPILNQINCFASVRQRVKLLLLCCVEERSSFAMTLQFLPILV